MQEIRSPNSPVVTGICGPNKSRAQRHRSLKLGSKYLKYFDAFSGKIMVSFWEYCRERISYFYSLAKKIISNCFSEIILNLIEIIFTGNCIVS